MDDLDRHLKIGRYILKQMHEAEACEFEAEFLSDKECLAQLEMVEKMFLAFKQAKNLDGLKTVNKLICGVQADDFWWRIKVPIWAVAALLLVSMMPAGLLYQGLQKQGLPQPEVNVVGLPLSVTRSREPMKTVLSANQGRTILSIYVDTEIDALLYKSYGFKIMGLNDPALSWSVEGMRLDASSMLYIDLGTDFLRPGVFEYQVLGLGGKQLLQNVGGGKIYVRESRI